MSFPTGYAAGSVRGRRHICGMPLKHRNHRNEPRGAPVGAARAQVITLAGVQSAGEAGAPTSETDIGLVEALGLLAKHVAFIHAGERAGRNHLALDLVAADVDRVLAAAGMQRRVDDRGDEWAELQGGPVMWLGHRSELGRLAVRP